MMKMTGDCDDPNPCDEMYGSPHKDLFVSLTGILLSLRVFLHLVCYMLEKFIFNAFGAKANFGPLDLQSEA